MVSFLRGKFVCITNVHDINLFLEMHKRLKEKDLVLNKVNTDLD